MPRAAGSPTTGHRIGAIPGSVTHRIRSSCRGHTPTVYPPQGSSGPRPSSLMRNTTGISWLTTRGMTLRSRGEGAPISPSHLGPASPVRKSRRSMGSALPPWPCCLSALGWRCSVFGGRPTRIFCDRSNAAEPTVILRELNRIAPAEVAQQSGSLTHELNPAQSHETSSSQSPVCASGLATCGD